MNIKCKCKWQAHCVAANVIVTSFHSFGIITRNIYVNTATATAAAHIQTINMVTDCKFVICPRTSVSFHLCTIHRLCKLTTKSSECIFILFGNKFSRTAQFIFKNLNCYCKQLIWDGLQCFCVCERGRKKNVKILHLYTSQSRLIDWFAHWIRSTVRLACKKQQRRRRRRRKDKFNSN